MITLLVTPDELRGAEVQVVGAAHRHLFRARRLGPDARLRVVDGAGEARWARVAAVDRSSARLELGDAAPDNEAALAVDLLVAAPKAERASWLVEKATELGVARVRFLNSARSPRTYGPGTLSRLVRVARAAVEQSGRSVVPEVTGVHDWEELPQLLAGVQRIWLLDPTAEEHGLPGSSAGRQALLVGPEGGLSPEESAEVLALDARAVGLGPRILRVETAALVGLSGLLIGRGGLLNGSRC